MFVFALPAAPFNDSALKLGWMLPSLTLLGLPARKELLQLTLV